MNHHSYSLTPRVRWRWPVPWACRRVTETEKARREKGAARVEVETILPCSADVAWREVKTSRLLADVCFPLVMFGRVDGREFPAQWPAGESLDCRSYLFGMIPLGLRRIHFERIDDQAREIQSRESDAIVARWDHLIRITPIGADTCRYRDEIEINAGWRTEIVAWFARIFYRHRQRRWRQVARSPALAV